MLFLGYRSSYVWSKHAKLRNYYTQQWAPKKLVRNLVNVNVKFYTAYLTLMALLMQVLIQMWVQAYRAGKQLYDNTNNGIEGAEQGIQIFFSKLLPEHDDVKITLHSSRCFCSCAKL